MHVYMPLVTVIYNNNVNVHESDLVFIVPYRFLSGKQSRRCKMILQEWKKMIQSSSCCGHHKYDLHRDLF